MQTEWIYGKRSCEEAIRAGRREIIERLDFSKTTRGRFDQLFAGANHQGVALRVSAYPYCDLSEIFDSEIVLVLDHLEDPQNVGSLLRTAEAAGVGGVIIAEDRAASITPAVVRASAGASEHLRIAKVVNITRAIEKLKEEEFWVTGLDAGADARPYTEIDFKGRVAIVVGNEGAGLARLVREHCDFIAVLPMQGHIGSLNAAVSGAIVLYEVLRQHGTAKIPTSI